MNFSVDSFQLENVPLIKREKDKFLNLFKFAPTEQLKEEADSDKKPEAAASVENVAPEAIEEEQPVEEIVNADVYTCSDGSTIPLSYLGDGGCDCPNTCEDENMGD